MSRSYQIAFFGSSLVSSYWNGAATYYRGLLRALAGRGHRVVFFEPDAFQRQQNRDMADPHWATVVVYRPDKAAARRELERARGAELIVKASGVGVLDEFLEQEVLKLRHPVDRVVFWDVDAPATLERLHKDSQDPFRTLIPRYDRVFTYGGGPPVVEAYRALGARDCLPIYNALDPDTHHPVPPDSRFTSTLAFLGNRMPDREARVWEFFLNPARELPGETFLLGGSGWEQHIPPLANLNRLGHVGTREHNAFNCTPKAVLNVNRDSMARVGYSPPTRIFEAAGAGACLISDAWEGIEQFLKPEQEILIARDGRDVVAQLQALDPKQARSIGAAALDRVLSEHTYAHRAIQVESELASLFQGA